MQETERAFGVADPSLAVGLAGVVFYSSQLPFINVFRQIGDFQRFEGAWSIEITNDAGVTERIDYSQLYRAGFLDENGYLQRLPEGARSVLSLFNDIPAEANIGGRYVFLYEGEADFRLFGGAVIESESSPGRLVIDLQSGFPAGLVIESVNEDNHLRNFALVREEHEALHEAGAIFNPDFIEAIADYRVLRFMDWMHTNNSNVREFSDLATVDNAFYGIPANQALEYEIAGLLPEFISAAELNTLPRNFVTPVYLDPDTREPLRDPVTNELVIYAPESGPFPAGIPTGVPLEIMVALANQTGADPWFNIPHQATPEFIRQFAEYIRDNLDPRLNVYIEYSNEVWNSSFDQFHFVNQQGLDFFAERSAAGDDFGDQFGDFPANAYYGYRSVEIISTFHEVFGEDAGRINGVVSTQTFNPFVLTQVIEGAEYYNELNGSDVPLDSIIDSVGITGYFGSNVTSNSFIGESLVRLIEISRQEFEAGNASDQYEFFNNALEDYYRDGTLFPGAAPELASQLRFTLEDFRDVAQTNIDVINGERLFGRPAGQAYDFDLIEYEGGPAIVPVTTDPDLVDFVRQFNRSEQLGTLQTEIFEIFRELGGTLANDFHAVEVQSFSSTFGTRAFLGDENAVNDATLAFNANAAQQFGSLEAREAGTFLQGITELGTAGNDTMFGTNEEDFLAAGEGNDSIDAGLGDDGLNGEEGNDTINGGGGADTIVGGDGVDSITGGNGRDSIDGGADGDVIDAGADDDFVIGGAGADLLIGGTGNDELRSGSNLDTVMGGAGNDTIIAQSGADSLVGGDGNDFISASSGFDTVIGGSGQDTLNGGVGADSVEGGSGNDLIDGATNNDTLLGQDGNDTINSGSGFDFLDGGAGDDVLHGSAGFDTILGGAGNDIITGGIGADSIQGGDGNDRIESGTNLDTVFGGEGDDTLISTSAADELNGDGGNDILNSGAGFDTLRGGSGNDTLRSGIGRDLLEGGDGDDRLLGESNFDTLIGGSGNDFLQGGSAGDTFVFADGFGIDDISDFNTSRNDEFIDLSGVTSITSFADLMANHLETDSAGNAVIRDGANSIRLIGVSTSDLTADDFIF